MGLTFCLSEDRDMEEIGLRLALCSLRRHQPGSAAVVYRPNPSPAYRSWLGGFPKVRLVSVPPEGAGLWNCKPHAMIPLLEAGCGEVVWLDSDILLTKPCERLFGRSPREELVVVQEPPSQPQPQGTEQRTRGWRLPLGRSLPWTVNSCVIRATDRHLPLLRRWRELLSHPEYTHSQGLPVPQRPLHMLSDQEVLGALVGSAEFRDVPVRYLRSGLDVLSAGGALAYSLADRLRGLLRPIPTFLHGQGTKPWWVLDAQSFPHCRGWFYTYRRWLQEVSPYFAEARTYHAELGGVDSKWMSYWSWFGAANRVAGLGHHAVRGLPLTAAATLAANLRRAFRRDTGKAGNLRTS